jgi:predicted transposase YbfD/YdcC
MCQDGDTSPEPVRISIVQHFEALPDPREGPNAVHKLIDIIVIAVCAVIAGCEACTQMAEYGRRKESWLRQFLELPRGIPSHDTFSRVLALLDAAKFQECFMRWAAALHKATGGKIVAIDGKTLRRSFDNAKGRGPIHLVSAWCSENHVSLGQLAVDAKTNEITAIPELLELLEIPGAIVTIDAAGCQRAIAEQIVAQGGDYVLGLKGNQSNLQEAVEDFFAVAQKAAFAHVKHHYAEELDKDHGRLEVRRYWITENLCTLPDTDRWVGLRSIGMVERTTVTGETQTVEQRYFINSIRADAQRFAHGVRGHWGIENRLHWRLDVVFGDDASRIRKGNAPAIMTSIRHLCMNLFDQEPSSLSLAKKRRKAAWNDDFRAKVVFG